MVQVPNPVVNYSNLLVFCLEGTTVNLYGIYLRRVGDRKIRPSKSVTQLGAPLGYKLDSIEHTNDIKTINKILFTFRVFIFC